MTFPGLLFVDPLKFPLWPPWGGEVDFVGSKPFPDLSECACIYKQNITDVAKQLKRAWICKQNITDVTKQLKHNFPPANISNVSPVGLQQRTELFASCERWRGYLPPAYWLKFLTLLTARGHCLPCSLPARQVPASKGGSNEPTHPSGPYVGAICFGRNHSQIYPHIRAKFGHDRSSRLAAYTWQTHTHTHRICII